MKFGFFAMPEHYPWENWTLSYDRDIDRIVYAEKMGFDEFWIDEHHTGDYENVPVPEYMIAKASASTHKIRLGTGVVSMPIHDPFQVAERLAFLDQLTHGRLIAGIGAIGMPADGKLYEVNPAESKPRMLEGIEILEKYWNTEEPIAHEGEFWKYNERSIQVRPYQENVPIGMAAVTSVSSFELAAEKGFYPISIFHTPIHSEGKNTLPSLKDQAAALDRGAIRAGRDPKEVRKEWRIIREVYVAESREQAIEDIREGVHDSYQYLHEMGFTPYFKVNDKMRDEDVTMEYMIEAMPWIIGSPEDCIEQIKQLEKETGGFGYFFINSRDWVPEDKWYRSIELFARKVMPAFKNTGVRKASLEQALQKRIKVTS